MGTASGADAEVVDRVAQRDMATIAAAARVTGAESRAAGMEDRTESTVETGVHA